MAFTLCSSEQIIAKAGAHANATAIASITILTQYSDEAEAEMSMVSRKDWVTAHSTLPTNSKPFLQQVASDLAGMKLIQYDMSGYTSREEAGTMLDVLDQDSKRGLSLLRDKKVVTFIENGA